MSDQSKPPFVGLRPFEKSDHAWFRGRDQEIATLLHKVRNNKFTAVVGASGSGKSSLVRAGVLPHLDQEGWKSIVVKPGSAPIAKLASALSESAREDSIDALANARGYHYDTALRQSAYGLAEITGQLAPDAPKLLLLVDQFEELFRYGEEAQGLKKAAMEEESHAFVELLLTAAAQSISRLHVVITMRSDFFGNCATYPGLAEAVSASQYLVPLPGRDQLETIIRGPITDTGGHIDNLLVQRLLLDVTQQTDLLPTLQHTLRRLWEAAPEDPKHLRDEDYRAIGGIEGSIHVKAEQLIDKLKQSHTDDLLTLEKLLKAITLLDEQGRATRRPQQYGALLDLITEVRGESTFAKVLGTSTRAKASLDRVLDTLAGEDISFIQKGTSDDPEIDISHEALIRSWQRLCGDKADFKSGWLLEEREDGRQWWGLVRRTEKNQWLTLREIRNTRKWIKQKKIGEQWCQRYGDSWSAVQTFHHKSLFFGSTSWIFAGLIIAVVGIIAAYQENLQQEVEIQRQQAEVLRQEEKARHHARTGALAAASLSHNYTRQGNARVGALVALSVIPENLRTEDPRYMDEVRVALASSLTRPIEIMRRDHREIIYSVSFSSDGQLLATGSKDGLIRLWDPQSGEEIKRLQHSQKGDIRSLAFSPDNSQLASGSEDNTIRLWNMRTKEVVGKILKDRHTGEIRAVTYSPDGSQLASASLDGTIRFWDTSTGLPIGAPLSDDNGPVRCIAFSPDGKQLVSGGEDSTLRLWNIQTKELISKFIASHEGAIRDVIFLSADKIVSAGEDGVIRLWNVQPNIAIESELSGHNGEVRSIAFSSRSNLLVSGSEDNTLYLWDLHTRKSVGAPLRGHQGAVRDVTFSPDGSYLVSVSEDNTMRLWSIETRATIGQPIRHDKPVRDIAFSPDNQQIVSGGGDNALYRWEVNTQKNIGSPLFGHQETVYGVAYSPDGNLLASASADGKVLLWDIHSEKSIDLPIIGNKNAILSIAFSPDGSHLVAGGKDGSLRLWKVQTKEVVGVITHAHDGGIRSVAFSPDGTQVVSAGEDRLMRIWNTQSGKPIGEAFGRGEFIRSVVYSPDGAQLVSAHDDGTLRIWNAETGQAIGAMIQSHQGGIQDVAFSPDGNYLVSGGGDGTLQLWNFADKTQIGLPLQAHTKKIRSVAFSLNGRYIASSSDDGTVRLWNANIYDISLRDIVNQVRKLCPLSETERRQLTLYDPQAATSTKPLTPEQRQACGKDIYP